VSESNVFRGCSPSTMLAVVSLLVLGLPACRRAGPEMNVGVSPRYPCNGESVTLTFGATDVDRVEVKDAAGTAIPQNGDGSRVITIPRIARSMLPLAATGWKGNASRTQRIPGDVPLVVIDGTITTESFPLARKRLKGEDRPRIGTQNCGCILDEDEPLVCATAAPIYEVNATYDGQEGLLESAWFSPRSRVAGMFNDSPLPLTYFHDGNSIVKVPSGSSQMIDYESDIMAAGAWAGKYDAGNQDVQHRGTYVDGGKVCSGWIQRREDISRPVSLKLLLRCMK
jgi:hypothetical protein